MAKKKKKVIKRKLKWKSLLKVVLLIALLSLIYLGVMEIPTTHIVVKGNTYVKDIELIRLAGYETYPKLFSIKKSEIQNAVLANPYISGVHVTRTLFGELKIEVEEAQPLLFNRDRNKLVLSNKKEVEPSNLQGVPVLTNYVPDSLYDRLLTSFATINPDIIRLISEIIYDPWKNGDVTIDETRFFLRMNDQNHVYINLIHLEKLNTYMEIYATLEGKKGILYLDSSSDKISFSLF